jgi:shikimate kinase
MMEEHEDNELAVPILFLTGMPGVGKTYWGECIAQEYEWEFADLDRHIEQQTGRSIPELFAAYGEAGFRERESWHLEDLTFGIDTPTVIACGGGTPCFNENMDLMKEFGKVVYLRATLPYLQQNLKKSNEERPLLVGDAKAKLAELLEQRKNIYEQADYTLDAEAIAITNFAEIITSCTNRH